jgi:hypothetical protein
MGRTENRSIALITTGFITTKTDIMKQAEKKKSSASSQTTTDHDEIREWVEAREGKPATVKGTGGKNDAGLLRIDFPGGAGEDKLQEISWEEFFEKFDEQKLAFLYQDEKKDGEQSYFNKLVSREE